MLVESIILNTGRYVHIFSESYKFFGYEYLKLDSCYDINIVNGDRWNLYILSGTNTKIVSYVWHYQDNSQSIHQFMRLSIHLSYLFISVFSNY